MDLQADQMTFGIGDDVALTALDLLARVKPAWTAASVVFTDGGR